MYQRTLAFVVDHPKTILWSVAVVTLFLAASLPWVLTVVMLPAMIVLLDEVKLKRSLGPQEKAQERGLFTRLMRSLGPWVLRYSKPIVAVVVL